jgi:hypothetical protein
LRTSATRSAREVLETDRSTRRTSELLGAAGDLLGSFLGGRRTTRSMATGAGRVLRGAASRRGQIARTSSRLEVAREQVSVREEDLDELEAELLEELQEIDARWAGVAGATGVVPITLERADVRVQEVALVWVPAGA